MIPTSPNRSRWNERNSSDFSELIGMESVDHSDFTGWLKLE